MSGRELPAGWETVTLSEISSDIAYGFTASASSSRIGPKLLRITDLQNGEIDWASVPYCECEEKKFLLKVGDIVFARTGATTGKSHFLDVVPEMAVFASYLIRVRVTSDLESKYISYFMQSPRYWRQIAAESKGSAQPGVNASSLAALSVPLAPVLEQRRIVEKTKALTARSRRAREALDMLPALIDRYRQSILAAAFRGDLTADWRNEPESNEGDEDADGPFPIPASWSWKAFGDVASVAANLVDPQDWLDSPHIAPNNIESKTGRLLPFGTIGEDGVISQKHKFRPGHIIYSKIRPYLAKAVYVDFDGLCSADAYPIETELSAPYLHKWMISPAFTAIASESQGRTVLPKINKEALYRIPVPVPPKEEQELIASRLGKASMQMEKMCEQLENAAARLATLDQSILAKAFRGELVPQDPNDEPAAVLLERIRAERAAAGPAPRRGRRPKVMGGG